MEPAEVCEHLGIESSVAAVADGWSESVAACGDGTPEFPTPTFLADACEYIGLVDKDVEAVIAAAERIAANPAAAMLAWHGYRRMYVTDDGIEGWPGLPALGDDAEMFYFVVLLRGVPLMRRVHDDHDVPAEIVADTVADMRWHFRDNHRRHGRYGVTSRLADWIRLHVQGRLYNIGRLQFVHEHFGDELIVYRSDDGKVTALADGRPIDPATGEIADEPLALDDRWHTALTAGDPVLEIHIPESSPLTPETCGEAVDTALAFFARCFPELPAPKALVCEAWLFDSQLHGRLKDGSNVLKFQDEFYLHPAEADAWEAFRHIFPIEIPEGFDGKIDTADLPRDTSLQRTLLAHVEAGGRWKNAGGFILVDDLPWGRRAYR